MTAIPAVGGDLEVLPLAGEVHVAVDTTRSRPLRWRWPWAVGAVVILLGALLFPVRAALAHTELDRIERVWATVLALDSSRTDAVDRMAGLAVASDARTVGQANRALDLEERHRLQLLARSLPAHRSFDSGVAALGRAVAFALRLDMADLQAAADARARADPSQIPDQSAGTLAAFERVDGLLRAQRGRFGEGTTTIPASGAGLHTADAAVALLSRYAPVSVGVKLLVSADFGARILDIDRSTDNPVALGVSAQVLPVGGFVVVADNGHVYRLPATLEGPKRDLGTGTVIYPSSRPDAVWIHENGTVREITTGGDVLVGAFHPGAPVRGIVDAGLLVLGPDNQLQVIAVTTGDGIRTINPGLGAPVVAAAAGDLVAWSYTVDPAVLNVTSVATGRNQAISMPTSYRTTAFGAISPDGRRIALYVLNQNTATFALAAVDLSSGHVDLIGGSDTQKAQLDVVWTPDSQRVFFVTNQTGATVGAWRIGDPQATTLRWRGAVAQALAVLP